MKKQYHYNQIVEFYLLAEQSGRDSFSPIGMWHLMGQLFHTIAINLPYFPRRAKFNLKVINSGLDMVFVIRPSVPQQVGTVTRVPLLSHNVLMHMHVVLRLNHNYVHLI